MENTIAGDRHQVCPVSERLADVARRLRAIEQRLDVLKARVVRYARKLGAS